MNAPVKQQPQAVAVAPPTTVAPPTMRDLAAMPLDQAIQANTQQFANALPAHIPVERFKRVVMTAISSNPDLAKADRRSLFNSAVKAAQDGLLPDGRDGALVVYNTNVKVKDAQGDRWEKVAMVQWLRMIGGVRKLIRNSGQISDLWAEVVYAKDEFDYQLGLNRNLHHKPAFLLPLKERGEIIAAYSVAKLKDGSTSFDVMSADEIWDTWRKASKQKDKESRPTGMWKDYPAEAFKKTVVKRHAKQLPMSTDLDDLVRDDEDLYDFKGERDTEAPAAPPPRPQITDYTDVQSQQSAETVDAETGEVMDEAEGPTAAKVPEPYGQADAYNDGAMAFQNGIPRDKVPGNILQFEFTESWQAGWDSAKEVYDEELAAKEKQARDEKARDDKANTGKLV